MRAYSILIFFTILLIVLFQACQPGALVKKTDETPVDSSLYFQQVEVVDPFIDSVFSPAGQTGSLSMTLIPPPPPEPEIPRFKEMEGFRVQIFAGIDSINAVPVFRLARQVTGDSIYLFKESGLFKIQVGDYVYRYQADSCNMSVRKNGYPGAWVVKRMVLVPIVPEISAGPDSSQVTIQTKEMLKEQPGGKYKIQVIATSTAERADQLVRDLKEHQKYPAFYEKAGTLYKVYVGPFATETDAREALDIIRNSGYPDAWLVY